MPEFDGQIPVYLQIMDKIKAEIVAGKLNPGEKLPSIRELSAKLMVNPNTIQRVFMELEREGIVNSKRGVGNFVAESKGLIKTLKSTQAEKYARQFLSQTALLGMTKSEVISLIGKMMEENSDDNT